MGIDYGIAADSNAVTYFMEAMWNGFDPRTDPTPLARERASMLLAYLYTGQPYTLLPTVREECDAIRDPGRRKAHDAVQDVLLEEIVNPPPLDLLRQRRAELENHHSRTRDCAVLAEAELAGLAYLLSFDDDFVRRLRPHAKDISLMTPSEYWEELAIPRGALPKIQPHHSNPLSQLDWWRI